MHEGARMLRKTIASLLLVSLSALLGCGGGGSGSAPPPPPPAAYNYTQPADRGDGWGIASAADHGLPVAILENMMNDIRAGQFPNIDSIAIARNGVLIFDETIRTATAYDDGLIGSNDLSIHRQFSASKSIMSLIVGIAIDEGYITDVGVSYLGLFPYQSYQNWDVRKNDITLENVLGMRLGLAWDEWVLPYTSPQNGLRQFYDQNTDYSKGLLDLPLAADPGSFWVYNTVATISLGQMVQNAVPMSLLDYMNNKLILPLNISDFRFLTTPTGIPNAGASLYFRVRDMAKFGQLVLDGGLWNGQRIVSDTWISASMTPLSNLVFGNPEEWDWQLDGYGYQWWTGSYDIDSISYEAYVAWGYGGQWIIVVPDFDIVIAANSHAYETDDGGMNEAHALVRNYILDALLNQP